MGKVKPMEHPKEIKAFERYLTLQPYTSKNTRKIYTRTIDSLLTIADKTPETLSIEDVEKWQIYAKKHYGLKSLSLLYSAVNKYIRYLTEKEINPNFVNKVGLLWRITIRRVESPEPKVLTEDEIRGLFEASKHNARDNAILKTLYFAVPRVCELIAMDIDCIDTKTNTLRMLDSKNKRHVDRIVNKKCIEALQEYLKTRNPEDQNDKALFLNFWGRRLGRTDVGSTVKRYAVKCGITKQVYPHLFRHSALTHLAQKGYSITMMQSLSKHKNIQTLKTYTHLAGKENKEVSDSLLSDNKEVKTPKPPVKPEEPNIPIEPKTKKDTLKEEDVAYNKSTRKDEYIQLLKDHLITPQEYRDLIDKTDEDSMYQ